MHSHGDVAQSRVESVSFRPMSVVKLRHPYSMKLKVGARWQTACSGWLMDIPWYTIRFQKKSHNASLTFASSLSSPLTLHPFLTPFFLAHPLSRSLPSVFDLIITETCFPFSIFCESGRLFLCTARPFT